MSGSDRSLSPSAIAAFRDEVYCFYRAHGRDLPWRRTRDPYRILVSEFMLQQTQVPRVIEKYGAFIERFPDVASLHAAPLAEVLVAWQGLGYNRRALYLKRLAGDIVERYGGRLPADPDELRTLPGIGPATAAEIAAFAFGIPVPFIETNIRTVYTRHFFGGRHTPDCDILPLVVQTIDRDDPRSWYYALMDYGTSLKKERRTPAARTGHPASPFHGSDRQIRGAILRELTVAGKTAGADSSLTAAGLAAALGADPDRVERLAARLETEGFLSRRGNRYRIAGA